MTSSFSQQTGSHALDYALGTLRIVVQQGQEVQAALDTQLQRLRKNEAYSAHLEQSVALCTELVYAYLRNYVRITWLLRRFARNYDGLPSDLHIVLGLAVLCLISPLTSLPVYTVFDWATGTARQLYGQALSGVTNGILRSLQREGESLHDAAYYARGGSSAFAGQAIFYSLPDWLAHFWRDAYGMDVALAYMEAAATMAPLGLRVNASKPAAEALVATLAQEAEAFTVAPWGVALPQRGNVFSGLRLEELLASGRASRQSVAAQEALWQLDPLSWSDGVWDCCAGHGGKSMALLESGIPVVLASDPHKRRLQGLPVAAQRLGVPVPQLLYAAAEDVLLPHDIGKIGIVLADVPCSGLGTLSRRPDAMLWRSAANITSLVQVQRQILARAAAVLPAGGMIAYITCTLAPQENEEQVAYFLRNQPKAKLVTQWATPPDSPAKEFFFAALLSV